MANYFYDLPIASKRRNAYIYPSQSTATLKIVNIPSLFSRIGFKVPSSYIYPRVFPFFFPVTGCDWMTYWILSWVLRSLAISVCYRWFGYRWWLRLSQRVSPFVGRSTHISHCIIVASCLLDNGVEDAHNLFTQPCRISIQGHHQPATSFVAPVTSLYS